MQGAAGFADDTVLCLDASYTHDLETVNIESFGKHVRLYTDAICNDEIAHITSNGCHVTPEDVREIKNPMSPSSRMRR